MHHQTEETFSSDLPFINICAYRDLQLFKKYDLITVTNHHHHHRHVYKEIIFKIMQCYVVLGKHPTVFQIHVITVMSV